MNRTRIMTTAATAVACMAIWTTGNGALVGQARTPSNEVWFAAAEAAGSQTSIFSLIRLPPR